MGEGVRIGCCGFPVSRRRYFEAFSVVELQQTFYQFPRMETIERWRKEAPQGFEFTMKASQFITHEPSSPTYRRCNITIPEEKKGNYGSFKPTDEVFMAWEATRDIALYLKARIVVFQCPASFRPTEENMERMVEFFTTIERDPLLLAWEPRGDWEEGEIVELCKKLDLIHTVDPFKGRPLYGEIRYFRLHGKKGYRYRYTDEDLKWLAREYGTDGYFMFNNVSMFDDAIRFKGLVAGTDHSRKEK